MSCAIGRGRPSSALVLTPGARDVAFYMNMVRTLLALEDSASVKCSVALRGWALDTSGFGTVASLALWRPSVLDRVHAPALRLTD